MNKVYKINKPLKNDLPILKPIKIALLGDTATQFLHKELIRTGVEFGFDLQIWEADFNQIQQQVYDANSELYKIKPEIVIIFQSSLKLLDKYNKLQTDQHSLLADRELESIKDICSVIPAKVNSNIIYYNFPEIDDAVFGNYSSKIESSFLFQLRKLNYLLMMEASRTSNLFLCDISTVQNQVGKQAFFQPSIYVNAEIAISIDVLPEIAKRTIDIIKALSGSIKKCVILDLDNTIWGGIVGDDGMENLQLGNLGIGKAFTDFQFWLKKLKARGIILAVCSKNSEPMAKEPFEKHPDMVLRLEDIAVFIANWDNKADNIRLIQRTLNIGFDSMIFLDDNSFERNMVRENIPEICVPELPEDPADFLEYLYTLNLFETTSFSTEDAERTKLYLIEANRNELHDKFANEEDFLKNLGMVSLVEPYNKFNTPRVAQLSQRSNQFNLRTVRYTEKDIERLSLSKTHITRSFTLEDKFGDNGLICVIVLNKESSNVLFIDTWIMSCRILKRAMENFVLNTIVSIAKENSFTTIKGEYIQTSKNEMVKDLYPNFGFSKKGNYWELNVGTYNYKDNHIHIKQNNYEER